MPKRRSRRALTIRTRIWVEVNGRPAINDLGADLLEQIAAHGSLSEATRRLRMSYRRAWGMLREMNRHWPRPLVRKVAGGEHGGGTQLTPLGRHVLKRYRDLQAQLDKLVDSIGAAQMMDELHRRGAS